MEFSKFIWLCHCLCLCICLCLCLFLGKVLSPHHSDQMCQGWQVSGVTLLLCFSKGPSLSESPIELSAGELKILFIFCVPLCICVWQQFLQILYLDLIKVSEINNIRKHFILKKEMKWNQENKSLHANTYIMSRGSVLERYWWVWGVPSALPDKISIRKTAAGLGDDK